MHFNLLAIPTIIGSAAFFCLGVILERRAQSTTQRRFLFLVGLILAIPGILFVLYYTHLFDRAAWFYNFRILPFTEITGSGLGLILGMLYSWFQPESLSGRLIAPTALLALVSVPFMKPILVPIDVTRLQDRCEGEVCMQSTFSTCGPSSAATILKVFGQSASERQLATESFTYRGGTEIWYLARALRRRGLNARVVQRSLDGTPLPAPAIAGVVLLAEQATSLQFFGTHPTR
jgi:peptidase C39-like protein